MELEFFEGDGEVVRADFGDFVVGVVGIFCEVVSEDFGFDEIFEALREVDREFQAHRRLYFWREI